MPYQLNWSDNVKPPVIVNDNTIDNTSTSLSLVGKGVIGYGEPIFEDFLQLLENFAGSNPPINQTSGQLWYDTVNNNMRYWNGTDWTFVLDQKGSLGNFPMNGNRVTGMADPVVANDAVNVQWAENHYVSLSGDTMTGDLTVQGDTYIGDSGNSVLWFFDTVSTSWKHIQWNQVTSSFEFDGPIITTDSVTLGIEPTEPDHAVTKQYVDDATAASAANSIVAPTSGTSYLWIQDDKTLSSPSGTGWRTSDVWVAGLDGSVTVYWQHWCYTSSSSTNAFARLLINGSSVGSWTAWDTAIQTRIVNINVSKGDTITLQWAADAGTAGESLIRNRRIYTGNTCNIPVIKRYTYGA